MAAHLHSSISIYLAGKAHHGHVPASTAPTLSRGRFPTPRQQLRSGGGGQRPAPPPRRQLVEAAAPGDGAVGEGSRRRRPRFLCLHGFRTSGEILRRQLTGRWPAEVTARLDLAFADAPFPAEGEPPVPGAFDPPYYEWSRFVGEDYLRYSNFDECVANVEELLLAGEAPFDGLLGFSQGGALSAALAGLQEQGLALTRVAKLKYVIVLSAAKIQWPAAATMAYANKIKCRSLHFIGDKDFLRAGSEELVESFVDPLIVRHPVGHTVPKLDEKGLQVMLRYLDDIETDLSRHSSTNATWKPSSI